MKSLRITPFQEVETGSNTHSQIGLTWNFSSDTNFSSTLMLRRPQCPNVSSNTIIHPDGERCCSHNVNPNLSLCLLLLCPFPDIPTLSHTLSLYPGLDLHLVLPSAGFLRMTFTVQISNNYSTDVYVYIFIPILPFLFPLSLSVCLFVFFLLIPAM